MGIIGNICNSCSCDEKQAEEYLEDELRHLRDMQDLGDLRDSDFEDACSNLGLESDYIMYFITQLAC